MKLICEVLEQRLDLITEANEKGGKDHYMKGIFMQAEQKNRNGRSYPLPILSREVARYNEEYVNKGRAFGELGHPAGPTVNLERVAILIKELKQDGNNFVGKAKIMDTPYGNIVKNLMGEGATLGVSSRGMGTLKPNKDGIQVVQDDYYLATAADVVADPSAPNAFVEGIMEGKEWVWENGILREAGIAEYKKQIVKASSRELTEAKIRIFKDFITRL